jgi:hypothetical protein
MPSKRVRSTVSAQRRAGLKRAKKTIQDLADAAGVSWRFAKYWVDDEKTSQPCQDAYDKLTGAAAA